MANSSLVSGHVKPFIPLPTPERISRAQALFLAPLGHLSSFPVLNKVLLFTGAQPKGCHLCKSSLALQSSSHFVAVVLCSAVK